MSVVIVLYKATTVHIELAKKWVSLLSAEPIIVDIPSMNLVSFLAGAESIVAFGKVASRLVKQTLEDKHLTIDWLELPPPSSLEKVAANYTDRKEAYEKMKAFVKLITVGRASTFPQSITITEEDLPTLSAQQILLLKKLAADSDRMKCLQVTKNKKLIEIGPQDSWSKEADIHLTYEEIYTIRAAMDVLGIKEVKIVLHVESNTTSRSGGND